MKVLVIDYPTFQQNILVTYIFSGFTTLIKKLLAKRNEPCDILAKTPAFMVFFHFPI